MRLTPATVCLGTLLSLTLLTCKPPNRGQEPNPAATQSTNQSNAYLFTGNPGIRTDILDDITGSLTGTVDGQPVAFGPDKTFPLRARTGYNPREINATIFSIQAQNAQYSISMFFNGPFEAGRNYRIYNPAADDGEGKFAPYIVQTYIRVPTGGPVGRDILHLDTPGHQVRITAITPNFIDIEFLFTLNKAGAVPERMAIRVKNALNENRNLRTQSEGEPHWDYTNVTRTIEGWGYVSVPGGINVPSQPTTTRVRIGQPLTTPVTTISYGGKTEPVNGQSISLCQIKQPSEQTQVEYNFGTYGSATGSKTVEIVWNNFTGVGTYTGNQVDLRFTNTQKDVGYWTIRPNKLASASTKWQVDVQRVTPDFIEGTYTIVEAPLYENYTKVATVVPALASVSGRFNVIYPR